MSTIIKEYGGLSLAIVGAIFGLYLITLGINSWKTNSRYMIAQMTGVSYDQVQYLDDVEE
jgi:hypothetical protein